MRPPDAPQEPTLHRIINMASVFGIVDIERVLGSFSKSVRLLEANRLQLSPWIGAFGDRCAVASDEVRVHVVAGQRELLLVGADVATVLCRPDYFSGTAPPAGRIYTGNPRFPCKGAGNRDCVGKDSIGRFPRPPGISLRCNDCQDAENHNPPALSDLITLEGLTLAALSDRARRNFPFDHLAN